MKPILTFLLFATATLQGAGFTEPTLVLYGRVLQGTGGTPQLLTAGDLAIRLQNTADVTNEVTLSTKLRPVGAMTPAAFSYAVPVPLKHDVPSSERKAWIDVKGAGAQMRILSVTINGSTATLASVDDGVLSVTQAQRADERRMDIVSNGEAADADGDGMPDWWEKRHGFDDAVPSDAGDDADGDTLANVDEYRLGTDPRAANDSPLLLTRALTVTRNGIAGVGLRIVDADTPSAQLQISIDSAPAGLEVRKDGAPAMLPLAVTTAELEAGRVTLRHSGGGGGNLAITLNDGQHPVVGGSVAVTVFEPSEVAGVQALLWLDAHDVTANQPVAAWADRSGRLGSNNLPRTLVQSELSRQPIASGGTAPAVVFGGNGRCLLASDASLPATTRAVFAWQGVDPAAVRQTVMQSNGLSWTFAPFDGPIGYPGATELSIGPNRFSGFRTASAASGLVAWCLSDEQGYALSQGLFDGSSSADSTARPSVLPALGARVRLAAGAPGQWSVEESFSGRVHELLTYDRVLSGRFAGQVEAYLLSRWQNATVWDYGESLEPMRQAGGTGPGVMIGGFGNDRLVASTGGAIVSGGPGDDVLVAGPGRDIFRYRVADSGNDVLEGFDPIQDRIDLSGRFTGVTGDLTKHVTLLPVVEVLDGDVRLTTRVELRRDAASISPDQTLTLNGLALNQADLGRLAGEGVIVAGDMVPDEVVAAAPLAMEIKEATGRRLQVVMQRQGNFSHAEEVPVRFDGDAAVWRDFFLEGVAGTPGRPTVAFARDAQSASFFIVPAVDAIDEPDESLSLNVIARPHHYRTAAGSPPTVTLRRSTRVHLSSTGNLIASQGGGSGAVILHRSGDRTGALEVTLTVTGDAAAGIDYQAVPSRVVMPDGASTLALPISGLPAAGPGIRHLVVSVAESDAGYIPVSPWSAEFLIVPGDALAVGGFGAWRASHDPGAGAVPLDQYATADRNGDGVDNFTEYLGGIAGMTYRAGAARDQFEILSLRDVPDAVVTIERSSDVRAWSPLEALSGTGVHLEAGRGYVRTFERSRPALRPREEFYRARARYRDPMTALSGTSGLFAGAALPVAASGSVGWHPSGQADGGLISGGLAAGGKTLLAATATGPARLNFEWFLSGAVGERLGVSVDGTEGGALTTGSAWTGGSVVLGPGEHRIVWQYEKAAGSPSVAGSAGIRNIGVITP